MIYLTPKTMIYLTPIVQYFLTNCCQGSTVLAYMVVDQWLCYEYQERDSDLLDERQKLGHSGCEVTKSRSPQLTWKALKASVKSTSASGLGNKEESRVKRTQFFCCCFGFGATTTGSQGLFLSRCSGITQEGSGRPSGVLGMETGWAICKASALPGPVPKPNLLYWWVLMPWRRVHLYHRR